jgi:DNA-3-methyladenine glycosylase II
MYKKALLHFKKIDQKLYRASLEFEIVDIKPSNDLFRDIVWTIIGQQLSGKAADTIFDRFETLFPVRNITPQKILKLSDEKMRNSGISEAKIRALRDLSTKVLSGEVDLDKIYSLSDTDVTLELIKVKGIGPWTAEMVLMFSLGRTDIFSTGDLGLKKGLMHLYGWKKLPNQKKLLKTINQWSPYKTYAAKILWKIADKKKLK